MVGARCHRFRRDVQAFEDPVVAAGLSIPVDSCGAVSTWRRMVEKISGGSECSPLQLTARSSGRALAGACFVRFPGFASAFLLMVGGLGALRQVRVRGERVRGMRPGGSRERPASEYPLEARSP